MPFGLPALPFGISVGIGIGELLIADTIFGFSPFGQSQWGIFRDGVSVVLADSMISLSYDQDWRIAEYQVEEGGFESYDKVDTPYRAKVRMATGGSPQDRQDFLDSINAIAGDLNLYDIVTPEQVYTSANVERFEYSRTATSGAGLISVDISLLEVRVTSSAQFTHTQQPSGSSAQNGGTVQTQDPTSTQLGLTGSVN